MHGVERSSVWVSVRFILIAEGSTAESDSGEDMSAGTPSQMRLELAHF
jgi:hypothetical protein